MQRALLLHGYNVTSVLKHRTITGSRIGRFSVLFLTAAACVHTGKSSIPTSSTESSSGTSSSKPPTTKEENDGANGPEERYDLVKKWASLDGVDFFKRQILTKETENNEEDETKDSGEFKYGELLKSKILQGLTKSKPQSTTTTATTDNHNQESQQSHNDIFSMAKTFAKLSLGDSETQEKMIQELVVRARESTGKGDFSESQNFMEILAIMTNDVQEVSKSLDKSFGHLDLAGLFPTSLFYYLEVEDERKNPSWKRRMHRFHKGIDINQVSHLNNMLYLSRLSYADTVDEIAEGCRLAVDPLELVYCDTSSTPSKPGHFIALKKNQSIWSNDLEVFFVVRGTKTVTDVMTDCIVDVAPYRGGKAHCGILQSGKWLVSEHQELLETLRTLAGKRRIKLTLVGHSLGAGAASIAGIEFDQMDSFSVRVIGFGCPSCCQLTLPKSMKVKSQL
ncbi:lipase [Fragilaria crotonensis]|nr:lipase [Fragilaria crotonensis]